MSVFLFCITADSPKYRELCAAKDQILADLKNLESQREMKANYLASATPLLKVYTEYTRILYTITRIHAHIHIYLFVFTYTCTRTPSRLPLICVYSHASSLN